ncbi:Glutathione S-transferase omega-like 2 [Coccomyxa sp. Obi]|nr:Glutathione S-transferase omega-like 2 [Coccomyxa sp. Obi]
MSCQGTSCSGGFALSGTHRSAFGSRYFQKRLPHPRRGLFCTRMQRSAGGGGASTEASSKGFGLLEWTGKIISQGTLVKGAKTGWNFAWETMMKELAPQTKDGSYARPTYNLKGVIGSPEFPAETARYHLYVGNACPWCHRVLLALIIRGLLPHISFTLAVDDPERASRGGWVFDQPEPVFNAKDLREVYDAASPGYRGRCTAPLLVDKRTRKLVCNESSDIVRMLNSVQLPGSTSFDLYPPQFSTEIDAVNDLVHNKINNGVYKSGFATTQAAYARAQQELYDALDIVEQRLSQHRFLIGDRFTEADLRLYPTVVRYDGMYATLFKCCRKRITDYPSLSAWLRDVYQIIIGDASQMQIRTSFDLDEARRSYFTSLFPLNPGGIVPVGPTLQDLALDRESGRGSHSADALFHSRVVPSVVAA